MTHRTRSNRTRIDGSVVLVTGAAGFIGSHLVERLLKLGVKKVIAVDSLVYGSIENLDFDNRRLVFIKHNLGVDKISDLYKYLKECDFVFHLAAQKHNQSSKEPDAVYTTNLRGTADLFDSAGKFGVKKIIYSSSLYAYGKMTKPAMKETDVPEPKTIYGISKLAGEHFLAHFGEKYDLDYISFRFFFVYGPKQYPGLGYKSVIVKNFENLLAGMAPIINGDGNQSLDYIYVDDVISAMVKAAESKVTKQLFNLGSGKSTKINDLTKLMVKISEKKINPVFAPADWTSGTSRSSNISKAKKVLGWSPEVGLTQGLTKTYQWLKEYRN